MLEEKKPTTDELLKKGSVTLTAKSRQEIYDQSNMLVDSLPKETKWTRTICQFRPETLDYVQTISITKK